MNNEKVVRTKTHASGPLQPKEIKAMAEKVDEWRKIAHQTGETDIDKVKFHAKALYKDAGFDEPKVVVVPSPNTMVATMGAAASLYFNKNETNVAKTEVHPDVAEAVRAITVGPSDEGFVGYKEPNRDKIIENAKQACIDIGGDDGLDGASQWALVFQGGNQWAAECAYSDTMRTIIGLDLPEIRKYMNWEALARLSGVRLMQKEFCVITAFPDIIRTNTKHQAHCEDGPSHVWSDGFKAYHWNGINVPEKWIMDMDNVSATEIITIQNVETRALGVEIKGAAKMWEALDHKLVDSDKDPQRGELYDVYLEGLPEPAKYLKAVCPRKEARTPNDPYITECVGENVQTVKEAHAWRVGLPVENFDYPPIRT